MRIPGFIVPGVFVVLACLAAAQTTPALRILSPKNGDKIETSTVNIRYELTAPLSAAGIPSFSLQLDDQDPVLTSDTEYTFYGLTSGWHSITVLLVDANGTPIIGAQNQVQFSISPPQ